jgi:capsular polysaccharide biosynthesis protein
MHVPDVTALTGNMNEICIQGLAALLRRDFGSSHNARRRVFISRSLAAKRRITNESEVIRVLERYGFETYHLERMDFSDQVKLMSETQYVVSINGAGLANMIFMLAGGSVLELKIGTIYVTNYFYALAHAARLKYFYELCKPDSPFIVSADADLFVEVSRLESDIKQMLSCD